MKITTPFTGQQVKHLRQFQEDELVHPFTCVEHSHTPMHVDTNGFYCGVQGCDYIQEWCHDYMADGTFLKAQTDLINDFKNRRYET